MKIIHTSDLHIGSPLTSVLPKEKVRTRRNELFEAFYRMTEEASMIGAVAFIIAGDLFDCENVSGRDIERTLSIIERKNDITFLYLPGNHEGEVLASRGNLPKNLFVFGKEWSYIDIGEVTFFGRSETGSNMFDGLKLDRERINIAVLHGTLTDRSREGGFIGKTDASEKGIDYIALGHYHSFSHEKLDNRTVAVYSGVPEGRGFDELGECGYVEIDASFGKLDYTFKPSSKRRILEIPCDITGLDTQNDILKASREVLAKANGSDIVRLVITGEHSPELYADTDMLTISLERDFFHFEVRDSSRLVINAEDYKYDRSLKGEFIRLILSKDELTDTQRDKTIRLGLNALMGDIGEV